MPSSPLSRNEIRSRHGMLATGVAQLHVARVPAESPNGVDSAGASGGLTLRFVAVVALALMGCASGGADLTALAAQEQRESARCGTPQTAVPPPGTYVDQALHLRYDKLVPEPDPLKNIDAEAIRDVVVSPRRLEQLYHDATHGNARAAWLVCQLEVGARSGGRSAAQQLAGLACQTIHHCSFRFDKLPFSKETASGLRILTITGEAFEDQATRLAVRQEIVGKALGVLVGVHLASRLRADPAAIRGAPRVLEEAALEEVRGAGPMQSFRSFSEFKRVMGAAGAAKQWHHIVEQTPGNVERFGAQAIHNTANVLPVDTAIHERISAYYSSKAQVAQGLTVRQWLSSQSFEAQRAFGIDILRKYGVVP